MLQNIIGELDDVQFSECDSAPSSTNPDEVNAACFSPTVTTRLSSLR